MVDCTPKPPREPDPPSLLIPSAPRASFHYFGCCPSAQTYLAYSAKFRCYVLFPVTCKRWTCHACAPIKIKKLSIDVQKAKPNRLLTLTVNPALYSSPRNAFDETRRKVPVLIRQLRKRFGTIEYLRITEATRKGYPHYHLLVRSGYLPQRVVRDMWKDLTGAAIVDLRRVNKTWSAYTYLVKYLSKLHNLEWTERHVSLSRQFVPKSDSPEPEDLELCNGEIIFSHPAMILAERYQGWEIRRYGYNAHLLKPPEVSHVHP